MPASSGLRIGDAEREAAAASLREHFAQGRLTLEEFQDRLDAAFAAKTDRDLDAVTTDLPLARGHSPGWTAAPPPLAGTAPSAGPGWTGPGWTGPGWTGPGWTGAGWTGTRRRHRPLGLMSFALIAIALLVIAGAFRPFGFFLLPRPLLILLALFAFASRIMRRVTRGGRGARAWGRRFRP